MSLKDRIISDLYAGESARTLAKRYDTPIEQIQILKDKVHKEIKARNKQLQQIKLSLPRHVDANADKIWATMGVRF